MRFSSPQTATTQLRRQHAANRRGAVSLWLILAGPALLGLLILVIELAHIWLARVELENALGAAALAAVKEWGDANGVDGTECPRNIGVTYAAANSISGQPLVLTTNFDSGEPNGNDDCSGDLIFGAITNQTAPFLFDAGQTPACGGGLAALDISSQSSLGSNDDSSFGISFQPAGLPANTTLRITRVIYSFPQMCSGVMPRFDARSNAPIVSAAVTDCNTANEVSDTCNSGGTNPGKSAQADVYGVTPASVSFYVDVDLMNDPCDPTNGTLVNNGSLATNLSQTLAVQFPDSADGLDPEDHMRFGITVINAANNGQLGADELGACGTSVTICFNDNTSITATFEDNDEKSNACPKCLGVATWGSNTPLDNIVNCNDPNSTAGNHGLIIHPRMIADIPCPPGSGNNNNGQSILTASKTGSGLFPFAVRAQKTIQVNSLFCQLCGATLGPFYITAKETAFYDCAIRCPRLIRIEPGNFTCP